MKYQSRAELAPIAETYHGDITSSRLSAEDRLRRWIELLREQPFRYVNTLRQTEYRSRLSRDAMRDDNSAITVAFEDPVLRRDGLHGDSYGDARHFFGLSDMQLHRVVCFCHNGFSVPSGVVARQLQSYLPKQKASGFFTRLLDMVRCGF